MSIMFRFITYSGRLLFGVLLALMLVARLLGMLLPASPQLAFAVRKDEYSANVYIVDVDRSLTAPLISDVYDRTISFAPDGSLVFSRYTDSQRNTIFSMNSSGSERQ